MKSWALAAAAEMESGEWFDSVFGGKWVKAGALAKTGRLFKTVFKTGLRNLRGLQIIDLCEF